MKKSPQAAVPQPESPGRPWIVWLLVGGVVLVIVLAMLPKRSVVLSTDSHPSINPGGGATTGGPEGAARDRAIGGLRRSRAGQDGGLSPATVVANRVNSFAQSRRDIAHELARRTGIPVPADVEQFFDAVQGGDWSAIKGMYTTLSAQRNAPDTAKSLEAIWPAVLDAYGAASVATTWPPNELLAYGESVVGSMRPGTVYLAGTEAGRFIPSLLSEGGTSRPMIVAPDSFSDPAQLEYLALSNPERFGGLNREDIDRILQRTEAPTDRGSVSGVDPKSVRQEILRALIERNPGTTFAVDGSFNLGELAVDIVPVGAVLEIRPGAGGGHTAMPPQRAGETADYWRATAERLQGEASLEPDALTRREYAQMALIQGKVLADQNLPVEAEQTYRAAVQMAPAAFEPLERLAFHLAAQGRQAEALELVDQYAGANPGYVSMAADLRKRITPAGTPR